MLSFLSYLVHSLMWCYVMLCYVLLCCVVLWYVMWCCVMLCYVKWSDVILCYVMLCDVMWCGVKWYDITSYDLIYCNTTYITHINIFILYTSFFILQLWRYYHLNRDRRRVRRSRTINYYSIRRFLIIRRIACNRRKIIYKR